MHPHLHYQLTAAAMNTNPLTLPSELDHQELAG